MIEENYAYFCSLQPPEALFVLTGDLRCKVPLHEIIFALFPAQEDLRHRGTYGPFCTSGVI